MGGRLGQEDCVTHNLIDEEGLIKQKKKKSIQNLIDYGLTPREICSYNVRVYGRH